MKHTLTAILALLFLAPQAMAEDTGPVVVELFTSQGCSSCPPADAILGELAAREDVLPLSFHVDYWDYIGWKDTFADPQYTARQFAYRDLIGARVVYTPQMIIDGALDVPGSRAGQVETAIAQARESRGDGVALTISDDDGMRSAHLSNAAGTAVPSRLFVVVFRTEATVAIARGENRGRTITYHNVVEGLFDAGRWNGRTAQEVSLPRAASGQGVVLLVQDASTGRMRAVARAD